MLPLSDNKWKEFEGGYQIKYDASIPLLELEREGVEPQSIWLELWENLYHQGDVGVASYAAIPHLARIIRRRKILSWDPFALAVTIELARGRGKNPGLPTWLEEEYHRALQDMAEYACGNLSKDWDGSLLKSILSLLAILKGNRDLGELILEVDEGYEKYALDKFFDAHADVP
ncbi:MAG TPA: hypothetical protein VEV81_12825 [Pyrinomonadaceae bacterium]|nr:hypothetical protein [Pyrinomonadaceae bacterium]